MTHHEQCAACGFDGAAYDATELLDVMRDLGRRWSSLLAGAGEELRLRPEPGVWSAIEYAAHSRDVTALHVFGVEQALSGTEPVFAPIDGDDLIATAAAAYGGAEAEGTVAAIGAEANRLAQLAEDAGDGAWSRGLTIGGERSDVRRLLEHALHDSLHHLADVERGVARLRN